MQRNNFVLENKTDTDKIRVRITDDSLILEPDFFSYAEKVGGGFPPLIKPIGSGFTLKNISGERKVNNENGEEEYVFDGEVDALEQSSMHDNHTDSEQERLGGKVTTVTSQFSFFVGDRGCEPLIASRPDVTIQPIDNIPNAENTQAAKKSSLNQ